MNAIAKNPLKTCPPPDPNLVSPSLVLPPGACDAHCHVFGPAGKFPYAADRSYTPPDAPVENLRRLHAKLGVSRAVIVHASCHGTEMEVTLDAIASSEGRYRGVACVEDRVTERELERLHAGGIRGIRFNFVKHLGGVPDLGVFYRLLARIKPLGWHVVHHRSHGPGESGRRTRATAVSVTACTLPKQSLGLDQGMRCGAGFQRKTAIFGCRSLRSGPHRGRPEPNFVGN
jgi:hypothetical protein